MEESVNRNDPAATWTLSPHRLTYRQTYFVLSHQMIAGDRNREKDERGLQPSPITSTASLPLHPPPPARQRDHGRK